MRTATMFVKTIIFSFFLFTTFAASQHDAFLYNGFGDAYLSLDGSAKVLPNGLLRLTDHDNRYQQGHAFYFLPLQFKNNLSTTTITTVSFSTTFVFAIASEFGANKLSGQGMAFVIAPSRGLPGALPSQYLGVFNDSTNGNSTNHVIAVELDTVYNVEFDTVKGHHVGIDINGLKSVQSKPPSYSTNGESSNLSLDNGEPLQVWVEYDGIAKKLSVTLAPINVSKPDVPLLSLSQDLSTVLVDTMYVGFSASTQSVLTYHYVLGWSFKINGKAQALNLSSLPQLPLPPQTRPKKTLEWCKIVLAIFIGIVVIALSIFAIYHFLIKNRNNNGWELNNGLHQFSYKCLEKATSGFSREEVIGKGGFGKVYRGILPTSPQTVVAVKKVSHDSGQGSEQFFAEINSVGRLRHRNLVPLFGYCEQKRELLLVYDFMSNGSVDKFLHPRLSQPTDQPNRVMLDWVQRFKIIKGVVSGLFYLHEECDQLVIHRDIKASNVLLDDNMNARLGDFGLAKLYDHDISELPLASKVAGTRGYIAPEMATGGSATKETDVYAFGVFLLEVACGKTPLGVSNSAARDVIYLVDWVLSFWEKGEILQTRDAKLGEVYVVEEMELVLLLGLRCSHADPKSRPTMREIMNYLHGDLERSKKQVHDDLALLKEDMSEVDMRRSISLATRRSALIINDIEYLSAHDTGSTSALNEAAPSGTT